ncbi:5769_t:CDS:10 [Diversispora eburnea]|uniref:5769_t:CDS:1 n=1 Tax=Diversispora eburnea TaxID=1213867 RepID=A0A9N8ZIL8_9GLOM|nr:5769_t:CDS:10 [Diversispora eburnea]
MENPGKEIRTKFIDAFDHWLNVPKDKLALITTVVEMLHTASLLIDDVEDNSILRRGVPVAHTIYEELLCLHRGQGMELYWRDTLTCPTEPEYIQMVSNKTGGLLRLGVKLMQAASKSKVNDEYVALVNIIGIQFQIRDDYMNLQSEKYADNKGFYILKQHTTSIDLKHYAVKLMKESGSFEYTLNYLAQVDQQVRDMIHKLGGNPKLEQQSDRLIRKRNLKGNDEEEDVENLSQDIVLASKSLRVLELRREITSARAELSEVKNQINNYGENISGNWLDYVQDIMEHLSSLLKKGIESASDEVPKLEDGDKQKYYDEYENSEEGKDFSYYGSPYENRTYGEDLSSPSESSTNSRPSSIVLPITDSLDLFQDRRIKQQHQKSPGRRHTIDSEGTTAVRLFIGNLGSLQKEASLKPPFKASTTTSISQEQTSANNTKLNEEFVDAVEIQQNDYCLKKNKKKMDFNNYLNSFGQSNPPLKRSSSVFSLPTILDPVPEDSSLTRWVEYEDYEDPDIISSSSSSSPFLPFSFGRSSSTPPDKSNFQISLYRSKPKNLFAEEVNVSNPIRIGTGYGSYIVYTCSVKGQEGSHITVRKRYSEFITLRSQLIKAQPKYRKLIPRLPPKQVMGKFMPEFIERRRKDLEYFLSYVLLHPVLGSTLVVRRWFMD